MLLLPYLDLYADSIDLVAASNVPMGILCSLAVLKAQSQNNYLRGERIRKPNNDGKNRIGTSGGRRPNDG